MGRGKRHPADGRGPVVSRATATTPEVRFEIEGPYEPAADDYECHGGEGYTIAALVDGRPVGELRVALVDALEDNESYAVFDAIHVHWVEVEPGSRRRGIATSLLDEARRRWPERELHTEGLTEEGEALWDSAVG